MTRRARLLPLLLIAPAAGLILAFLIVPYLNILVMSFRPTVSGAAYGEGITLANYARFLGDGFYLGQLVNTLWIGAVSTATSLVLGFPIAWQLVRGETRLRGLYYGIVLSPLLVGIVIRSYGWTIILGNNGLINRSLMHLGLTVTPLPLMYNGLGIIIALTHVFLPFMVLPIMGALQGVDPNVEQAARSLGAGRATIFRRITLPLAMPGIQAGCILVFVLAVSAYVTPVLIGGSRVDTMAVTVVDALIDSFQWPFGSAMALILTGAATAVILIFARTTRMRWTAP